MKVSSGKACKFEHTAKLSYQLKSIQLDHSRHIMYIIHDYRTISVKVKIKTKSKKPDCIDEGCVDETYI
jgi:hypothetical protein